MRRPSLFFDIGAEDQSGRAFSSLQSALSETDRRAQRTRQQIMAFGAAAVAAVTAVGVAALRGASQIDEVAKAARRLEMDVTSFRALQLVASEAGVSVEGLANDIQNANREIERSSAGATRAAQALGLSIADLGAMDSNARLEAIADRMQEMGLTAGQASQVLRDFGIRNREMVLMMMQGGDAFRNARRDINDYGLALSQVDASRIETANDQISRLGFLAQFVSDRLALALVPALGAMANAITDSMRQGGLLRAMLDNIVPAFQALSIVVVSLAATQIPALAAALAAKTFALGSAAIAAGVLTTAMRTLGVAVAMAGGPLGILAALLAGAGAYMLLFRDTTGTAAPIMDQAAAATNALNAALAVSGDRLPATARATLQLTNENIRLAQSAYAAAEAQVALAQAGLQYAQTELNLQMASSPTGEYIQALADMDAASGRLTRTQADLIIAQGSLNSRINEGQLALNEAAEASANFNRETTSTINLGGDLADALSRVGGSGGAAAAAVREVGAAAVEAGGAMDRIKSSFETAFVSFVTGAASARDAIRSLLQDLARLLAQSAFRSLFGRLFSGGGFFGSLFGGARADGGPVTGGKTYLVGERGPELFTAPHSGAIIPNHAMGGSARGGEARVHVTVSVDQNGNLQAFVDRRAQGAAGAAMQAFNQALPGRIRQFQDNPRRA
jgi:hypothetical protein